MTSLSLSLQHAADNFLIYFSGIINHTWRVSEETFCSCMIKKKIPIAICQTNLYERSLKMTLPKLLTWAWIRTLGHSPSSVLLILPVSYSTPRLNESCRTWTYSPFCLLLVVSLRSDRSEGREAVNRTLPVCGFGFVCRYFLTLPPRTSSISKGWKEIDSSRTYTRTLPNVYQCLSGVMLNGMAF